MSQPIYALERNCPAILLPTDALFQNVYDALNEAEAWKREILCSYEPSVDLEGAPLKPGASPDLLPAETTGELRALFESHNQVITPSAGDPYEASVFIGNLLYFHYTPGAIVLPKTPKEIAAVINFAKKNKIPFTVKNGGHSYAGYCLNFKGIMIDLTQMKSIHIDQEAKEVTIGSGCIWKDVYDKLDPHDIVVGGQCPFVGVSGFTLGGGLSPFTRSYGMGVDNVLEMTVITAAGELLTLRPDETDSKKRDLFWAMRGAGGGNFAVLVEFKTRLHKLRDPNAKVVCGPLKWNLSVPEQRAQFELAMEKFNNTTWPNELTIDAIWRHDVNKATEDRFLSGEMTVIYNGNEQQCKEVLAPLLEHNPIDGTEEMPWSKWVLIEIGYDVKSPVFHHHASFIFGEKGITSEVTQAIISIMEEADKLLGNQGKAHILWDMTGGKAAEVPSDETAYYWREGVYVANFKIQWQTPAIADKMLAFAQKVKKTLMPYALDKKACYVNYIDSTVEDWQYAYHGKNYARLQQIKKDWDPLNFFKFAQSIAPAGSVANKKPGAPTAVNRTADRWSKLSWCHPEKLWDLETCEVEGILGAIAEERAEVAAAVFGGHS
ncbi:hypothetical protein HGRIS_011306 [Hohenbuehelia grisea]|uniref:FAD-binding PCMH-type domain-containing protein n=1 Tax=Hohenbuehelia grisea TaxID=104357 RepID=A0ABR3JUT7_9AGAR